MGPESTTYLAFAGHFLIARGELSDVAREIRVRLDAGEDRRVAVLHATTSAPVDLDLRGSPDEVAARAEAMGNRGRTERAQRGPGRPRLGVVGKEVTLLPRHWDWLAAQPGGASVTLRKLVEAARKSDHASREVRQRQDAAYRFMLELGGDLPGFEEAIRALYAWELDRMEEIIASWPEDLTTHVRALVQGDGPLAGRGG